MLLIWCAISGHGYGHAAQVVPVLNELGNLRPGLKAILRTTVPETFFRDRLTIDWAMSPAEQDIGCVQRGPLHIDVPQTWREHEHFHEQWERKLQEEAQAIRSAKPDLVLSDISYLAIEAGNRTDIPTVALCSLSWDTVLEEFQDPTNPDQKNMLAQIRDSYGKAEVLIRPFPGISMNAFRKVIDVGPIRQTTKPDITSVRKAIRAKPDDTIVLVGFGGIPLESLPLQHLQDLTGYRVIISGPVPPTLKGVSSDVSIPLSFRTILASSDIVMTKPGYSTIVDCVAQGKPVVYVRRYNFADEDSLVTYLHRYGRGVELPLQDFVSCQWQKALDKVRSLPAPHEQAPSTVGAEEAARVLASYL